MTEKRLKTLIKQRKKVWSDGWNEEVQLDPKTCSIERVKWSADQDISLYLKVDEGGGFYPRYWIENLREDIDRAKWESGYPKSITVEFNPPFYKDIVAGEPYLFEFLTKDGHYIGFFVETTVDGVESMVRDINHSRPSFIGTGEDKYVEACNLVSKLLLEGAEGEW